MLIDMVLVWNMLSIYQLLCNDYTMKYNTQKEKISCNFILAMVQSKAKEGCVCV